MYNRCVLEAEWPTHTTTSVLLWNKLRHVVLGAAHFRRAGRRRAARKDRYPLSASTEGATSLLDQNDRASRSSLDSHDAPTIDTSTFDKFRSRIGSIILSQETTPEANEVLSSAGLLISGNSPRTPDEDRTSTLSNDTSSPTYRPTLARSDSFAGDARILDGLISPKCARLLNFSEESLDEVTSPSKVSPRTPVTENDPLGALETEELETEELLEEDVKEKSVTLPMTDTPILFKNSTMHRSATFEGSPPSTGGFTRNNSISGASGGSPGLHRSETVPASTVTAGLASLGSSIKLNFR